MTYFKKILHYAYPYKSKAFLNIFFNILYAIFSALSFVVLMPLLKVIFKKGEAETVAKPVYEGFTKLSSYFNDYYYHSIYVFNKC